MTGRNRVPSRCNLCGFALLPLLLLPVVGNLTADARLVDVRDGAPPQPTPAGMVDRLAEPPLSESPTQIEMGRYLYYHHCMPCHGDRGQGLTDEWREVWVEDHQNCWARGCHTGKSELTAFSIPRSVPPVSGSPRALKPFRTHTDLFVFLRETQPPQRPGALSDDEYWAVTAFLLHENGRLPEGVRLGAQPSGPLGDVVVAATAGLLLVFVLVSWAARRRADQAVS